MSQSKLGLVSVPTRRLKRLLQAMFRDETTCPLTPVGLTALGLQDWVSILLGHMRHLDKAAVTAVLVATIAERTADTP